MSNRVLFLLSLIPFSCDVLGGVNVKLYHSFKMIEKLDTKDSGSKINLKEIQESADEEPIMNAKTQPEVVTPIKPDDISLPIHKTSGRVIKPPQFYYGFHIKKDKSINSTLSELDEPANYKEAMTSPKAAKWNEAMKIKIQFIYDNQ
nr:hypothetical protein [Tanacetum cinerariifolium]